MNSSPKINFIIGHQGKHAFDIFLETWAIFGLFLIAPVQATSGDKNKTPVLEHSKRDTNSQIF